MFFYHVEEEKLQDTTSPTMASYNIGYKDTRIQGYKDTRIQGYKDTRIQGYKDTRIQGYKDTRIQGYKDTRIQGYKSDNYFIEFTIVIILK